jgi:hypothetical protein
MRILLALLLLALASGAQARHRIAVPTCVPTSDVMRPCAYQANPFAGVRSIKISLHRERRKVAEVHHYMDGVVRSVSGATARVAAGATGAFQCLVSALDSVGYPVRFMGGLSNGHMRNSLHHVGLALDVNQYSRNVTRPAMPSNEIALANGCGLVSGAQWSGSPDSGHFQLNGWAGSYVHRRYARR